MFDKAVTGLAVCLGLAACAQHTPPQTDAASHNALQAVVGKWHCTLNSGSLQMASEDEIRADGTWFSHSKLGILFDGTLGYHYQYDAQDSWRLEGDELVVKGVSVSHVRELPAKDKADRLLMTAFERKNPEIGKIKQELFSIISTVDETETRLKILRLTATDLEMQVEKLPAKAVCRRIG